MKKIGYALVIIVGLAFTTFLFGPKIKYEPISIQETQVEFPLDSIEDIIAKTEKEAGNIKPENMAEIIWYDSLRKTEFSIVYLHGFSASHFEGNPIHKQIAKKYGCNLYLSRLDGHGIAEPAAMGKITPNSLLASAQHALNIGKSIGEKVIVMSCSTGGTLALFLAAKKAEDIHALVLYSPNIRIYDRSSKLLTGPWGEQLAYQIVGKERIISESIGTEKEKYWTVRYETKSLLALQSLIDQTMNEDVFSQVNQPYLMGYYYKNEEEQDQVVSVEAMQWFHRLSGTPNNQKVSVALPNTGNHVVCSDLTSQDLEGVLKVTSQFFEDKLFINPVSEEALFIPTDTLIVE